MLRKLPNVNMWQKKKEKQEKKKNPQPVWSALPGCCYLAVYDTQIEGGLVK